MLQSKDREWLNGYKNETYIYMLIYPYRRFTSDLKTNRLEVRRWRKVFHANGNQKKAGVLILTLGKIDFKTSTVTRDKERHYMMIKGSS